MDFSARFLLVKTPSSEILQERLEKLGKDAPAIQKIIEKLSQELDESKIKDLFDTTIVNGDMDKAAKEMGNYIFEKTSDAEGKGDDAEKDETADEELPNGKEGDAEMVDAGAEKPNEDDGDKKEDKA